MLLWIFCIEIDKNLFFENKKTYGMLFTKNILIDFFINKKGIWNAFKINNLIMDNLIVINE